MRLFFSILISSLALSLSACASAQIPAGTSTAAAPQYLLGPGDKLRITVFGEDDLSGDYSVTSNGDLSLPLLGDVPAVGRSASTLQGDVIKRLTEGGYMVDPRVSVEVLNYRPYYILGEVEKSGEFPYVSGLSGLQAVAIAGGFSYRANRKKLFIRHAGETVEKEYNLNSDQPVWILPGDTIRVGERYF